MDLTGFDLESLEIIFDKYCGQGTPIKTRKYLYDVLFFLKTYPTLRADAGRTQRKSFGYLYDKIRIGVLHLSCVVDELNAAFQSRLDPDNEITDSIFDDSYRLCLDSFPIYINRPQHNQHLYYNGKYKSHIVKVQCLSDNRGNIVWFGNRIWHGAKHDLSIYKEDHPVLSEEEHILADKAYYGRAGRSLQLVTAHKKPKNGKLSTVQKAYNFIHARHRITVEHAFGFLKRFSILSSRYRGRVQEVMDDMDSNFLFKVVKVIIHLNYIYSSQNQLRYP